MSTSYFDLIVDHYKEIWKNEPKYYLWDKGPVEKLPSDFRVLEFPPADSKNTWTYATSGMSAGSSKASIELHIFSACRDNSIVELLTAACYYHHNTSSVGLNHTVNFGRPWQNESLCEYGLISLPYIDGPDLENLYLPTGHLIKFYWLIPITFAEVNYKAKFGIEALEEQFEKGLDYLNPKRKSLISG